MRQYLRHPSDIPLAYHVDAVAAASTDHLRNISQGGLCFNSRSPIAPGSNIHVEIPIAEPVFEADGIVAAIAGRSLYEGTLDFKAAIEVAAKRAG